ncbi:hypothetical protein BDV33DRAFT_199041 [Aspergillus novoparasiticus]|uniref:Jacalin-type lectin domain-containing protein n=1 Tax=Aspergillus novoparasiticus TaxID=986946 RepID=A0A5N6F8X9_9EURO|nr:hypothetical protein BDV33DRAFT_199041 [Aspergillus novoparasiticus]
MATPWVWLNSRGPNEGECVMAVTADAPVSEMSFWERSTGAKIITAFNVTWANGKESATYGYTHGATRVELELKYGEFFKEVTIYSNTGGRTECFSGWEGTTNIGREVNIGYTWGYVCSAYHRTLYSGLCVGFQARLSQKRSVLNKGGIVVLNHLQHVVIKMNYLKLPKAEVQSVLVDDTTDENDGETPLGVEWIKPIDLTHRISTRKTSAEELDVTKTVLGKIFDVSPEDSTKCTVSEEISKSTSYSRTTSTTLSRSYEVPPGRTYRYTAHWPEGPAQEAFGVASGNVHIRVSDIMSVVRVPPIGPPPYIEGTSCVPPK